MLNVAAIYEHHAHKKNEQALSRCPLLSIGGYKNLAG